MKKIAFLMGLVLIVGMLGCSGPAGVKEFSADMVTKAGGRTQKGKIYFGKDKFKMDMSMGKYKSSIIVRNDKKLVYVLMPAQKMYMVTKITDDNRYSKGFKDLTKNPGKGVKLEKLRGEEVNGVPCTKYKITSKGMTVYQWISKKHAFPLRSMSADGSWSTEMKNFKSGKQAASIFELPAGYKKFTMPKIPGLPKR